MTVLIINAGSTSLKCKLLQMPEERTLAKCRIERIGDGDKGIYAFSDKNGKALSEKDIPIPTYAYGLKRFLSDMADIAEEAGAIERVGFKTVLSKGFSGVHVLTEDVLQGMRDSMTVAPAHNAPYLAVIEQMQPLLPDALFVGAFETAFHQTIPLERATYGVPFDWTERYGVRRMGYHGASHEYSAAFVEKAQGATGRMVSCHLGGSGSLCAIEDGKSVDTTFGLSLQTGLIHSSRVGDMDAFVIPHLVKQGLSMEEIESALCKNGGLKGISGVSGDLRDVYDAALRGNPRAALAVDVYINGIVKWIGAFVAEMGGLDTLSFTGGIGENAFWLRKRVADSFAFLGLRLDDARNAENPADALISAEDSAVRVYVIAADEEIVVARKTCSV